MTAYIIIAIVLILLLVLLFAPSIIEFSFLWNENERKFSLVFKYLFIKLAVLPKKKKEEQLENEKKAEQISDKKKYTLNDVNETRKKLWEYYKEVKSDVAKIFVYAKNHAVVIKKLDTDITFDISDPMQTGIVTGAANGTVYNIIAFLDRQLKLNDWHISIVPLFQNRNFFDIRINGIIRIKNAHIIFIIFRIIPLIIKMKKHKIF